MAWDPALLRKYNTTGHFRLLNQVRAELREQPIQRPLVTTRGAAGGGATGGAGSRLGTARSGSSSGGSATASASSAGGSAVTVARADSTQNSSTHAVTRRRAGSASAPVSLSSASHDDQQPIMAVPVLTDVVMPDSHTGG